MEITCKNCNQTFKGHYCNNCGQPADTHRINAHFLWHDIQHGLLHFDNGIPYSIKQLFIRPGHSIREFIEGKRIRHFKPLSLVAVLGALYGFLYHYFHINLFQASTDLEIDFNDYNEWMATHFAWVTIATIPIYTIGTYIVFRKQGYNFVELFVLNTFKASQRLSVQILTFPILFRMQLRSLPGQLSFRSVVQALLISATRASLALHASENSAACVFTQSLMRPPPGLTSAHFALMSAAQAPIDRSFAIATDTEKSTTAPITMTFLIIILPKRKEPMRLPLTHWASVRCTQINRLYMVDDERHIQLTYVNARYFPRQAAQSGARHHELPQTPRAIAVHRAREEDWR